jgi:hypothetical protein
MTACRGQKQPHLAVLRLCARAKRRLRPTSSCRSLGLRLYQRSDRQEALPPSPSGNLVFCRTRGV